MEKKVLVETSARHVHLTPEHIEILFGKGHELTVKKMLSQDSKSLIIKYTISSLIYIAINIKGSEGLLS